MKKIVLVLAFLLVAFGVMAQDINYADIGSWMGVDSYVSVGYASSMFGGFTEVYQHYEYSGDWYKKADYPDDYQKSFYTILGFDLWFFNTLFIGASITCQVEPWQGSLTNWNPTFTNYMFEAGLKFGIFTLGWQHECTHPQNVYQYAYRVSSLWGEGAIDKLYLEMRTSFGSVPK